MGTTTKNSLLLVAVIVLVLALAELAVRWILRDITTTADNRSYFALRWKAENVRRNSLGFRDDEPAPGDIEGLYRIAFIGDSFAFGQGIPESLRMSDLVESRLRSKGGRIEVRNFGDPGINTADEVRVLQQVLSKYHPHFVLLQWYVNDVIGNAISPLRSAEARDKSSLVAAKQWLRNRSALYFLVANAWHQALAAMGHGSFDELDELAHDSASPDSVAADEALRQFLAVAASAGVSCGIVLVPDLSQIGNGVYRLAYMHHRVLRTCQELAVDCLDLTPAFSRVVGVSHDPQELWVNRFDAHMGVVANALAAEEILRRFEPRWPAH
jgi:hypothetical protein